MCEIHARSKFRLVVSPMEWQGEDGCVHSVPHAGQSPSNVPVPNGMNLKQRLENSALMKRHRQLLYLRLPRTRYPPHTRLHCATESEAASSFVGNSLDGARARVHGLWTTRGGGARSQRLECFLLFAVVVCSPHSGRA
jgi:hypothetical protein